MTHSLPDHGRWGPSAASSQAGRRRAVGSIVLLAVLLACWLRASSLTAQSFWRDEVDALCYAFEFPHVVTQALTGSAATGPQPPCACPPLLSPLAAQAVGSPWQALAPIIGTMIRQNGPFYFFLLRGWIALAGHSEYALRFFSLWFGVLGVPLTYVLGARLLGRTVGRIAALLVATSPYLVWYGQEVKMYTLVPALALLALYALRREVESGGWWWVVQVAATSLAFYAHIWSALLVPVQVGFLLLWWPRWRPHWRGVLIGLALLTLPYLPLAAWQVPAAFIQRETGFPRYTLGQMILVLINGWGVGISGQGLPWAAVACAGAALVGGTAAALSRRAWRTPVGVAGWLTLPLLGIWAISQWQPLFTDRYLIWAAPGFYLLAGAGVVFLHRQSRWLGLALLAAILAVFSTNLAAQAQQAIKSDLRAAAAQVEEAHHAGDLLIFQIPHSRYTFDYYFTPTAYNWAEGPYTNHRLSDGSYLTTEETLATRMAQITWGYDTVWLVASEVGMWDERNLVQQWLEENGERISAAHFVRVDVYGYRLTRSP